MGGSSKNKQTQSQTTTTQPYPAAQPLLNQSMGDALNLYKNGGLVKPNTMSTVVPYSDQSNRMMAGLEGLANANMDGRGLSGQYQSIINNGGYNQEQKDALGGIRETANSNFDPYGNPAFKQVLEQAQGAASNAVNQNTAAMGRYGSGTHQGVMAREIGDLTSRAVGDEYRNWQGRKDSAQSALFNAGQTGQGNLGAAYEGMRSPLEALGLVGSMKEDLAGRELNDRLRIAQEQANAPLANIQALNAIASGASPFGTTAGTTTAQGPSNTFSNLAGGALGGASLLSGGGKKL